MKNFHGYVLWLLAASVAKRTKLQFAWLDSYKRPDRVNRLLDPGKKSAFAIRGESAIPLERLNTPTTNSRRSITGYALAAKLSPLRIGRAPCSVTNEIRKPPIYRQKNGLRLGLACS